MWILLLTNRVLILLSGLVTLAWTYYEGATNSFMDPETPFYFPAVWGGTIFLASARCLLLERSIWGKWRLRFRFLVTPYTLCALAFLCAFTLHALAAVTRSFDVEHLNMPFFLPAFFLPLHFMTAAWLVFRGRGSAADRGFLVLVFYATLNGAVFNTEFFTLFGFALVTLMEKLIETRGRLLLPRPAFLLPLVIILAWAVFATFRALDPMRATHALLVTGVFWIACFLAATHRPEEGFHWKLLFTLLLGGFLTAAAAGVLVLLTGNLLGARAALSTRLTLFYQHPNFLAPYLAMLLVLSPAYAFFRRKRPDGWVAGAATPLFAGLLILTDSRAGYLGAAAGLLLLCIFATPLRAALRNRWQRMGLRTRRRVAVAALSLTLLAAAGAVLGAQPLGEAVMKSTRLRRSLAYRLDAWANSVEVIKRHPVHGVGLNTFLSVKKFPPGSKFSHERSAPHPHNLFLYVAQSFGLPALLLFLALLGGFFHAVLAVLLGSDPGPGRALVTVCLPPAMVLLTCGLLDLGLCLETLFPGPLWIFLGVAAAAGRARPGGGPAPVLRLAGPTPLAASILAAACMAYGFLFPATGRILLKQAGLSLSLAGEEEAIRKAYRALRADPLLNKARTFLVRRLLAAGNYTTAETVLRDSARIEPENPEIESQLGTVHASTGEMDKAAEAFRKAVAIDHGSPELPRYYARLIEAEAAAGEREQVEAHLKAALRRDIAVISLVHWHVKPVPEADRDDLYLPLGDAKEAVHLDAVLEAWYEDLRRTWLDGRPQDRFDWCALCQSLLNVRSPERALAVLDDMERIFGEAEAAVIRYYRATAERARDNLDQSGTLLARAEELGDPTNPAAKEYYRTRRSEVLLEEGRYRAAAELLRRSLGELRDYRNYAYAFEVALDNLLRALDGMGRVAEKVRPLQQRLFFCKHKREYPPFLAELARSLAAAGRIGEAELEVARLLSVTAATAKRLVRFEDPSVTGPVRAAAFLLADRWRAQGLSPEEGLRRAWTLVDFYSPKPAYTLFRYHFLSRLGLLEQARSVLDLARMDGKKNLTLLRLHVECAQMADEPEALRNAVLAQARALQERGVDLEARARGILGHIAENPKDPEPVLELVRTLILRFRLDHALNAVREARRIHPRNGELEWLAARAHRLNGDPAGALEAVRRAEVIDPKDHRFRYARENLGRHLAGEETAREGGKP